MLPDEKIAVSGVDSGGEEYTNRPSYAVFCYLFGILFAIIFLLAKPYKCNRFIRFHAVQSLIFFAIWLFIVPVTFSQLPAVPRAVGAVVYAAFFVMWVFLMVKTYRRQVVKLPIVGSLAERLAA